MSPRLPTVCTIMFGHALDPLRVEVVHGAKVVDREIRVEGGHQLAQGRGQGDRVSVRFEEQGHLLPRGLGEGHVQEIRGRFPDPDVLVVPGHAHDLGPGSVVALEAQALAQRVPTGPELRGQVLVDDGHPRRVFRVGHGEAAPLHDGYAQGVEVVLVDRVPERGRSLLVLLPGVPLGPIRQRLLMDAHGDAVGQAGRTARPEATGPAPRGCDRAAATARRCSATRWGRSWPMSRWSCR